MPTPEEFAQAAQRQSFYLSQERFGEQLQELAHTLGIPMEQVRQLADALHREFPHESRWELLNYVVVFHRKLAELRDEEEITIQVRCKNCEQVQPDTICRGSLKHYQANADGTYTSLSIRYCAECAPDGEEG